MWLAIFMVLFAGFILFFFTGLWGFVIIFCVLLVLLLAYLSGDTKWK